MKIFRTAAVKELDAYTIEHEPIASIDLMERAAGVLANAILECCPACDFHVFAGPGNNGGDGLAVARLLRYAGCRVSVSLINPKGKLSPDCAVNLQRLHALDIAVAESRDMFVMPSISNGTVVVDALFGSGLVKPVCEGIFADVINEINALGHRVAAVDMPSGLLGEDNHPLSGVVVNATDTFTLQFPKLSLLMPENACYAGNVSVLDIGLSREGMVTIPSDLYFIEKDDLKPILKSRERHSHKGDYGRALLVAGSKGMAGASVLSARAALRSGVGLLTVHLPLCSNAIVQVAVPEAMTTVDSNDFCFSDKIDTSRYSAVAVGPGIGQGKESEAALLHLIENSCLPMVLDADALNILSRNPEWLYMLPKGSILTPHPGEFERLFGKAADRYHAISSVRAVAREQGVVIVLKGAYTVVISPDGNLYFNSTGNPGMATGGSGDVLTGIVLALLAQGYSSADAARVAVYAHGLAGDFAAKEKGETALVASDIIEALPKAWLSFEKEGKV